MTIRAVTRLTAVYLVLSVYTYCKWPTIYYCSWLRNINLFGIFGTHSRYSDLKSDKKVSYYSINLRRACTSTSMIQVWLQVCIIIHAALRACGIMHPCALFRAINRNGDRDRVSIHTWNKSIPGTRHFSLLPYHMDQVYFPVFVHIDIQRIQSVSAPSVHPIYHKRDKYKPCGHKLYITWSYMSHVRDK